MKFLFGTSARRAVEATRFEGDQRHAGTRARLWALLPLCLVQLAMPQRAAAQPAPASPWNLDLTHDRATATNHGNESIWTTDRVQLGWTRPEAGGWFLSAERQQRGALTDVATTARGYRRVGDWTAAIGGSVTPDADFLSRVGAEGEVSRRLAGTLVASAGYRYLAFRRLDIHQAQPALTWYHARGHAAARLYLSHNTATGRTSPTVQLSATLQANPRLDVGGGVAYGDRIFDIASLPTGASHSAAGFVHARLGLTRRDSILIGAGSAHEDPAFEYRVLSIGYRRAF